jgi:hypothetical protein
VKAVGRALASFREAKDAKNIARLEEKARMFAKELSKV